MNIEEIRNGAPNGAIFYAILRGDLEYIKCDKGFWFIWVVNKWESIHCLNVRSFRDELRRL